MAIKEVKKSVVGSVVKKPIEQPIKVEPVVVEPVVAEPAKPEPVKVKKYLGVLGAKRVVSIGKKVVNGVEYNEITNEEASVFLLSDRDLKVQLQPIE